MKKQYSTFIIDDDPIFVLLFKKIIEKSERFDRVQNFPDGQYAIEELIKMVEHCKRWDTIYGYSATELFPELKDIFVKNGY